MLLDIRKDNERLGGRFIEGSLNVPMEQILDGLDLKLPIETTIIILCERGGRAAIVKNYLDTLGYADANILEGGYQELHKALERK